MKEFLVVFFGIEEILQSYLSFLQHLIVLFPIIGDLFFCPMNNPLELLLLIEFQVNEGLCLSDFAFQFKLGLFELILFQLQLLDFHFQLLNLLFKLIDLILQLIQLLIQTFDLTLQLLNLSFQLLYLSLYFLQLQLHLLYFGLSLLEKLLDVLPFLLQFFISLQCLFDQLLHSVDVLFLSLYLVGQFLQFLFYLSLLR